MKIQPIDINTPAESTRFELVKPVAKSRLKRLFERQFSSVLKISAPEKSPGNGATTGDEPHHNKDVVDEFDPSSVCLDKMVQNFIEESNDRQQKCGRNRCNCFNGNGTDSSDDEFGESNHYSSFDACEILKVCTIELAISGHNKNLCFISSFEFCKSFLSSRVWYLVLQFLKGTYWRTLQKSLKRTRFQSVKMISAERSLLMAF